MEVSCLGYPEGLRTKALTCDRRHVFRDVRPYICTRSGCHASLSTFSSRTEWVQHEIQEHFLMESVTEALSSLTAEKPGPATLTSPRDKAPAQEATQLEKAFHGVPCPLCRESLSGSSEYIRHVGRHLESISLASLPQDNADESEGEGSIQGDQEELLQVSIPADADLSALKPDAFQDPEIPDRVDIGFDETPDLSLTDEHYDTLTPPTVLLAEQEGTSVHPDSASAMQQLSFTPKGSGPAKRKITRELTHA